LLLVRSHQAEIIILKRFIQGRKNATRLGVEPVSSYHDRGSWKSGTWTRSVTLST